MRESTYLTCPQCKGHASYFTSCDTFGCETCDIWTETPHCDGQACEYFQATPERPSLYTGKIERFWEKNGKERQQEP